MKREANPVMIGYKSQGTGVMGNTLNRDTGGLPQNGECHRWAKE